MGRVDSSSRNNSDHSNIISNKEVIREVRANNTHSNSDKAIMAPATTTTTGTPTTGLALVLGTSQTLGTNSNSNGNGNSSNRAITHLKTDTVLTMGTAIAMAATDKTTGINKARPDTATPAPTTADTSEKRTT